MNGNEWIDFFVSPQKEENFELLKPSTIQNDNQSIVNRRVVFSLKLRSMVTAIYKIGCDEMIVTSPIEPTNLSTTSQDYSNDE